MKIMWVPDRSSRYLLATALALLAAASAGCGGTTTSTVVGPTGDRCAIAVSNDTPEVPAGGGNGALTVNSARECSWSASAEASWITLRSTTGQGPATVEYSVLPNPDGKPRRGRVTVSEHPVEIAQAASPCRYEVSPSTVSVEAAQEQVSVTLSVPNGCEWKAASDVPWIGSVAPAAGTGSATVRFTVAANATEARSGTVAIGDATVRINQSAPAPGPLPAPSPGPTPGPTCNVNVSPARLGLSSGGDQATITVTAQPGCAWTARSSASWLTIAGGDSGTGNGSVRLSAGTNTGSARTATLTVADKTVTVEQAAAAAPTCTYNIKPTFYNAGRGPDEITIDVTAPNGCTWTTANEPNWVTVSAGRSGSGNGTVRLLIPANSGSPRTAVLAIAGHTFTLHQEGPCDTNIKPGHYNAGRGPDDIRIEVTADGACSWSATSTVPWVTVAEGRTGSGNGTVRLLVQPNGGAARSVVLTIAGQPFELRQNGSQ
jgi:hypothetical protein